ncbi:MAG: right-handed parallel beta-helix repeat-containing protein [Desulfosarcina sp.]|nr:right-handed parallel beta-helix repeat-containing protein [Desulfosarcina sp.]MBC2741543.1 right-handed parallel beta-helix repeat-containing protein [Desulfosarcina sp.]MBC2764457.1 right-handed parallel beta-helix repeat-containing protein [Desulfosarcina sp.]
MIRKLFALILSYLMIVTPVWSATYYVAQTGAGDGLGGDYANRASIAYHNAGTGVFGTLDDHTVVLCGAITTSVLSPDGGTSGHVVTYDGACLSTYGYGSDAVLSGFDAAAGYSSHYVYKEDDASTIIQYLDAKNITIDQGQTSEMGDALDNDWGLYVRAADYVNIDKYTIQNCSNGAYIYSSASHVTVTDSLIQNNEESGIYVNGTGTYFPSDITIGGSSGNGNTFKNNTYKTQWHAGGNPVAYDVRLGEDVDGVTISYNTMYADVVDRGMSAVLIHSCQNVLVEHNLIYGHQSYWARPPISVKGAEYAGNVAYNLVIRFNKLYNANQGDDPYGDNGITVSGNWHHVYVYCNYLENTKGGINLNLGSWATPDTDADTTDATEGHAWGNVINNAVNFCFYVVATSSAADDIETYFYNNTCYLIGGSNTYNYKGGFGQNIGHAHTTGALKNNIFCDIREGYTTEYSVYTLDWVDTGTYDFAIDKNLVYQLDAGTPQVYYDGSTTCEPCAYNSANNPDNGNYIYGNPLLSDPASDDFSISSTGSPAYEAGATLTGPASIPADVTTRAGSFSYADIFDPTVNLSGSPSSYASQAQTGTWHLGAVDYAAGAAGAGATRNRVAGATVNGVATAVVNRAGE